MPASFTLREMLPSDGPALSQLMENDPETPGMSMTTRFLVDPYQAWKALKPDMIGVVAEAPGVDGLIGAATVSFENTQFDGRVLPGASLENLKVHHEYRGKGIGAALALWRVNKARERFGDECVVSTGTNPQNTASLSTMKKWCKQFVGPIKVSPRGPRFDQPEAPSGITFRAIEAGDMPKVVEKANRFYADYNLYAPLSTEKLNILLQTVYHYRVASDSSGKIVAGALFSTRGQLMVDEFRNVPPEMEGRVPPDHRLRLLEMGYLWFDQPPVAQGLWEHIAWEFRDRANAFSMNYDKRSPVNDAFPTPFMPMQLEITVAVSGPTLMDDQKFISGFLRG